MTPGPDLRWRAPGTPAGPRIPSRLFSGEFFRENAADFMLRNAERYGDLVRFRALGRDVLQVNHPELVGEMLVRDAPHHHRNLVMQRSKAVLGEGLLTSEEPLHMRQRRLAQPAFHRARIHGYGEIIADAAAEMAGKWQPGASLDVHGEMLLLALRIVGRTLFSLDFESQLGEIAAAVDAFQSFLPLAFLPFPELLQHLPLPMMRRIREGRETMDRLIYGVLAERRADPRDRGDLLSMLLASVDTEAEGQDATEARMSDTQVRDECVTVLLAGHETTANALSFILWQLACHPEVQEQLAAEVRAALGDRCPTADDYAHLPYTEQVVAEGMRLYPPVWVTSRMAAEDYPFRGTTVRKGTFLLAPQIAVHRDPRFWPDPLRFDPNRFPKNAKAARPKLAYFPFGAGSRQCIGEGLAWMEAVLALAVIAGRWRLSLLPNASPNLRIQPAVTLRPRGKLLLQVDPR